MTEKKHEKITVTTFFVFYKKREHYGLKGKKATFFDQLWTHFDVLDIYKCPKSVFESKTWKIVCFFILPNPLILYI